MPVVARPDHLAARDRAPSAHAPVEVHLTEASRPATRTAEVRLNVAWLLVIVFGIGTVLATAIPAGDSNRASSTLTLFGLTVAALVWTALETWTSWRRPRNG
jgi:hypothetical protein